jgi:hypothetical protein
MADTWVLVEPSFKAATARAYEGLFTLGSGYMHIRGSLEEHLLDDPQNVAYTRTPANVTTESFRRTKLKWGTYVPGVFGRHPMLNNEMINLPFFMGLAPVVVGEKLDMEASRISGYRRELLLREAVLRRTLVWHAKAGANIEVTFERFISAARPSLCAQRLTLMSDRDVEVEIRGGIDADVRTNGFDNFSEVSVAAHGPAGVSCSFSPGLTPTLCCASFGPNRVARSTMVVEGIFGTKISPPRISSMLERTKFTPCVSVIQKRVMRSSVMGSDVAPSAANFWKKGTTLPREPTTLP